MEFVRAVGSSLRRPRVLLFARQPYSITAARLPKSLREAGWSVAALTPEKSFLWKTRYTDRRYSCPWNPRPLVRTLLRVLNEWQPEFVIAGDRWSQFFLNGMADSLPVRVLQPPFAKVLRRSLGKRGAFAMLEHKASLLPRAAELGVSVPHTIVTRSFRDARRRIDNQMDFPVVIKQDQTSGGAGVSICRSIEDVSAAYARISAEPRPPLVRRLWKMWNQTPFVREVDRPGAVLLQEYLEGEPYLYSFVAVEGRLLAGNVVRRELPYDGPTSPHCRYVAIEHAEIVARSRQIIEATGFSGLGCVDFIIERSSRTPYLIECNPVPVNVAHLGRQLGSDLCLALLEYLHNDGPRRVHTPSSARSNEYFGEAVLFPYDLIRDPASPVIAENPLDVPFDDPQVLAAMMEHFRLSGIPSRRSVANISS